MAGKPESVPPADQNPRPVETGPAEGTSSRAAKARFGGRRALMGRFAAPLLLLAIGLLLIVGLGVAQRVGWISAGLGHADLARTGTGAGDGSVRFICPMMCTPPQMEPGRCPVCAMELVPATADKGGDDLSIEVTPVARRVAGIETVAVKRQPLLRTLQTIGEIGYDEGTLKTLSAYVDGRLDRLYADYTGVVVSQGDELALLYSPEIYAVQVELIESKQALAQSQSTGLSRITRSQQQLYQGARQKLRELGMVEAQLQTLEQSGKASFRIALRAPIGGTVIAKYVEEGAYVTTGAAIYRLADLSNVWLILKLFPDDAAAIRYGQKVTAQVASLPGKRLLGRVVFIDPSVDPETRSVRVRVVFANPDGLLRIGDYAKAQIEVPTTPNGDRLDLVYDPDLAGKWISPRHPHVIKSAPGSCPICSVPLVPASDFGFADAPTHPVGALVVPRDAVLLAGGHSVVYVEVEPGRFEIRSVVLGPYCGAQAVIVEGVQEGAQVAVRGNFLIDSQMQLAGKPSLIDPTRHGAKLANGKKTAEVAP